MIYHNILIYEIPFFGCVLISDLKEWSQPPSLEFINLVLALLVWSSRYPSVFWGTSKPFATIFSLQMLTNSIDILLGFAGVSVIYKLQIVGMQLPLQVRYLRTSAFKTIKIQIN